MQATSGVEYLTGNKFVISRFCHKYVQIIKELP